MPRRLTQRERILQILKLAKDGFTNEYGFKSYRLKPETPEFPEPTKDQLIMEKLYLEDIQLLAGKSFLN